MNEITLNESEIKNISLLIKEIKNILIVQTIYVVAYDNINNFKIVILYDSNLAINSNNDKILLSCKIKKYNNLHMEIKDISELKNNIYNTEYYLILQELYSSYILYDKDNTMTNLKTILCQIFDEYSNTLPINNTKKLINML